MDKSEVLERLCALVTEVGSKVFNDEVEHDCFCGLNYLSPAPGCYQCHPDVIEFIEQAVRQKIGYGDIEPG